MKVAKFVAWLALSVSGLAVLLYLVAIAVNWRDQPPSAATLEFRKIIADRPVVAETDNAFVYLLGFNAPQGADPREIGARRLAWLATFEGTPGKSRPDDPLPEPIDFNADRPKAMQKLDELCRDDDRKNCAHEFEMLAASWHPTETESLQVDRYRALISLRAFREVSPLHYQAPLPAYAPVLHAQRLLLMRELQQAANGDSAAIRETLEADLVFWREAMRSSDILITKMISVAGIRNHFFFSNLVLRRLPPQAMADAIPEQWAEEFSAADLSMRRVMAGELLFQETILKSLGGGAAANDWLIGNVEETLWNRSVIFLSRPLFQGQDQLNHYAAGHLHFVNRYSVPLSSYEEVAATAKANPPRNAFPSRLYNLTGDYLRQSDDYSSYEPYAFRVGGVEGMRRAALLTAQLRARSIPASKVADHLRASELRDPYDSDSFDWDEKDQAVVFDGPEDHRWRRHAYYY